MTKKKLLHSLKFGTFCRIKRSKIHGVGVFAVKPIPKGLNPFPEKDNARWYSFSKKELSEIDKPIKNMLYDFFSVQNGFLKIPEYGLNEIDISFFMNYSKKPNVRALNQGGTFLTLKKIPPGKELTIDYQTFDEDSKNWKVK